MGFCYIKTKDTERKYIIHLPQDDLSISDVLPHEIKHALYYELGLSGEPALCSYKTKFIRDVYQITSTNTLVPSKGRTVSEIYDQCPDIAMDWDTIEEAWNMIGFIEVGDTVYINELSDLVLPFNGESAPGDTSKSDPGTSESAFAYHAPLFMRSHIYSHQMSWKNFLERCDNIAKKSSGNSEGDIATDESNSHYLKVISVALNIPPLGNVQQNIQRRNHRSFCVAEKAWYDKYTKLKQEDNSVP